MRRIALLSGCFLPLRSVTYAAPKKKQLPVTGFIIRESLKLKTKDGDQAILLHDVRNA